MATDNTSTQRICANCGRPIPPSKRSDALYDTDYCRWEAHQKRKAALKDK